MLRPTTDASVTTGLAQALELVRAQLAAERRRQTARVAAPSTTKRGPREQRDGAGGKRQCQDHRPADRPAALRRANGRRSAKSSFHAQAGMPSGGPSSRTTRSRSWCRQRVRCSTS